MSVVLGGGVGLEVETGPAPLPFSMEDIHMSQRQSSNPFVYFFSRCRIGEGSLGPRGGVVRWRAHRLSYTLLVGEIPNDLVVMHSCDNKLCVNPKHLSVGTIADNNHDMINKGRDWYSKKLREQKGGSYA